MAPQSAQVQSKPHRRSKVGCITCRYGVDSAGLASPALIPNLPESAELNVTKASPTVSAVSQLAASVMDTRLPNRLFPYCLRSSSLLGAPPGTWPAPSDRECPSGSFASGMRLCSQGMGPKDSGMFWSCRLVATTKASSISFSRPLISTVHRVAPAEHRVVRIRHPS